MLKKILIILIILSFQSVQAYYGTRPMGMGGAYTAISDDATAAYYNPAGMALNPGIDIMGSTLLNNRNQKIGDNLAALKMNFELDMDPFTWIVGIGFASLLAYNGAKYLSDKGVVKKGWGRKKKKTKKSESMAEEVKKYGSKKVRDVKKEAKEKAKEFGKKVIKKSADTVASFLGDATEAARIGFMRSLKNPWYHRNYHRPTYWERRHYKKEYSPDGKSQFALGVTWVFDKNLSPTVDQNTSWYSLTLASGYEERIAVGMNFNLYDMEIPSIKVNGFGTGFDAGVILRPVDEIAFGLVAKELLTSEIRWDNGASTSYGMTVNSGVALVPVKELTLAIDLHNLFEQNGDSSSMHYGIEYRIIPGVALRAGLHDNSKTAGLSFGAGPLIVDYAYLGGVFNRTQTISCTWKI